MQEIQSSRKRLIQLGVVIAWFLLALAGCSSTNTPPATALPPTVVVDRSVTPTVEATSPVPGPAATEAPTAQAVSVTVESSSTLSLEKLPEIDSFLASAYDGEPFQGAVLVARNGEVLLRKGYGMADQ